MSKQKAFRKQRQRRRKQRNCHCDSQGMFRSGGRDSSKLRLGREWIDRQQYDQAEALFQELIDHDPRGVFEATKEFVLAKQFDRAERLLQALMERYGPNVGLYAEFGAVYRRQGRMSESREMLEKALALRPNDPGVLSDYGNCLSSLGEFDRSIHVLEQAVRSAPTNARVAANFVFNLNYQPTIDRNRLYEAHLAWGRAFASVRDIRRHHPNPPDPDRRLRVGYLSPDFRFHSVTYFFEPILDGRDAQAVEVFCYSHTFKRDKVTERLQAKCDCWRDISRLPDAMVLRQIADDGIDILVDLAGHTGENRLNLLATKPAPVQVTYLGYPNTTGMPSIDYRLSDAWADPPGSEAFCTEELVRLPDGFLCFHPPEWAPPVAPLPGRRNGFVTFGSFNNHRKINPLVIGLWSQVLRAVEGSRMLLKIRAADDPGVKEYYYRDFEACGVSRDRVEVIGTQSFVDHLATYGRMDISLDTYPYHGTTTTFESLWMGVPVITLVGENHASRVGYSILSGLGLELCAARHPAEFVAKAARLAEQADAREGIRSTMRLRMAQSKLLDSKNFCRQLEDAYRVMWRRWCQGDRKSLSLFETPAKCLLG